MIPADRLATLQTESQAEHDGVFIVGENAIALRQDTLPAADDSSVITASFCNCRCSSDEKAIKQFHRHARVPSDTQQVALGHETVQVVLQAPTDSGLTPVNE